MRISAFVYLSCSCTAIQASSILRLERAAAGLALQVEVLGELLRDRRAALPDVAGLQVVERRARDAVPVERAVLPVAPVLDRDRGRAHRRRDVLPAHADAVLGARDHAERLVLAGLARAVARVHARVLAELDRPKPRELGQVVDERGGRREPDQQPEAEHADDDEDADAGARPAGVAALALAPPLARVAGQRPVVEARRGGGGCQACAAPVSAAAAARSSDSASAACAAELQRPRTSIVTVSAPTSRTITSTSRSPASRGALAQGRRGALPLAGGDAGAHAHDLAAAAQRAVDDRLLGEQGVRELDRRPVLAAQPRVGEPDLLDHAVEAVDADAVAEADRLAERQHDAGHHVRERALRRQADDDRDDGSRGEHGAGVILGRLELPQDHARDEHDGDRDAEPQQRPRPRAPRCAVARQVLHDAIHG